MSKGLFMNARKTLKINQLGHLEIGGADTVELQNNSERRCMSWMSSISATCAGVQRCDLFRL